jgi:hypothetical protein
LREAYDSWKEKKMEQIISEIEALRLLRQNNEEKNSFFKWVCILFVGWIFAISAYNSMQIARINGNMNSIVSKTDEQLDRMIASEAYNRLRQADQESLVMFKERYNRTTITPFLQMGFMHVELVVTTEEAINVSSSVNLLTGLNTP